MAKYGEEMSEKLMPQWQILGLKFTKTAIQEYVKEKFQQYLNKTCKLEDYQNFLTREELKHIKIGGSLLTNLKQSIDIKHDKRSGQAIWCWTSSDDCDGTYSCRTAFEKIVTLHQKYQPDVGLSEKKVFWENSDNSLNISLEWAIAKMFMPPGNKDNKGPDDTNPYSMFYLMSACTLFNSIRQRNLKEKHDPKRGRYRMGYDNTAVENAYNEVRTHNIPIQRAAKSYGVPVSTLKDRVYGNVPVYNAKSGRTQLFSEEQESLLASHLNTMAEIGYGYSRTETINLASDYAVHLGLRDREHPLSLRWLYKFLGRFPELSIKKPRSLESARARSATRPAISNYFSELNKILVGNNLIGRPEAIFNVDEKGLSTLKPPKIVTGAVYKAQAVTSGKSQTVTVIGGVNAMGNQVSPFFIFPGKRMLPELLEGASAGATGVVSETGWSNTDIFAQYMKQHLVKYLPAHTESSPVLVLYDGHKSHISLTLIDWAKENHIILFVLPPHCSHLLQPLDISCFGPFEISWNSACHSYMRESGGRVISRYDVCNLLAGYTRTP